MKSLSVLFFFILIIAGCNRASTAKEPENADVEALAPEVLSDTLLPLVVKPVTANDIRLTKALLYDKYTLEDRYAYKDTFRVVQWDKIREELALLENSLRGSATWGVLQNRNNIHGEAALVGRYTYNDYKRVVDTLGVEKYQSAPLYLPGDSITPVRYGRDGWLVKLLSPDSLSRVIVEGVSFRGTYEVPKRYIANWGDTILFHKVVVVDVTNQNVVSLEKSDSLWLVRSVNPATTGRHNPPYAQETPIGLFAIQEKKIKMLYNKDGSSELAGYAPYASRFSTGAYLHGVPTNRVSAPIIEYSPTLGTIPRSHKCVRMASSHAKYIYEWGKVGETVVFVID